MNKNQYVGTAVFCGNSILLAKRIETYKGEPVAFGGYWSIFCGCVEEGEDFIEAAHRELHEETKIIPQGIQKIRFFRSFSGDDYDFSFHTLELDELISPQLCFEHTEFGWFKVNTLDSFDGKIDDQILFLINMYNQERVI